MLFLFRIFARDKLVRRLQKYTDVTIESCIEEMKAENSTQ